MNFLHPSALECLRATECVAATAAALMSAEALAERQFLHPAHPAAWARHPHPQVDRALKRLRLDRIFGYRATLCLLVLRLATAGMVITSALAPGLVWMPPRVALTALLLVTVVWHLRGRAVLMGSDQMVLMCALMATWAEWLGTATAYRIGLSFLAALAALAYGTAGLLKVRESGWHDGRFLLYVCSTEGDGHPGLARWLRRLPRLTALAGTAAVSVECLLCMAWLLPPPLCLVLLGAGVMLHAGIARVMGLNTYMFAFAASYPATFYVSTWLWKQS